MRWIGTLTKFWAWFSTGLVFLIIVFLFGYVFSHGAENISVDFLTQAPKGMVVGSEGGIWPAIAGSLWFTGMAVLMGSIPAVAVALYQVFYCKSKKQASLIRLVMECISGLPSLLRYRQLHCTASACNETAEGKIRVCSSFCCGVYF